MDHVVKGFSSLGVFADFIIPKPEDFELIRRCGFSEVIIGMAPKDWKTDVWNPKFKKEAYVRAFQRARNIGLTPHLMIWAHRTKRFLEVALPYVVELIGSDNSQADSLLLDCEVDWHKSTDGLSPDMAALLVNSKLLGKQFGVTGLSKLHSSVSPLSWIANYVVPQAYSIWKPCKEDHWSHGSGTFPGTQQIEAFDSWSNNRSVKVVMGLANYWGARPKSSSHPAITQLQAIRWCMSETLALGVKQAWFWSLKWIKGNSRITLRQFFGSNVVNR